MSYALENVREKFELKNRNYVVTGGAQGIGFAVARAICEMGGNIALLDIKDKPIDEYNTLSTKFGTQTTYIQTDVSKEESLTASFQQAIGFLGSIDGCVTAAGIAIDKPFVEQQWKEVQRIQEINVSVLCKTDWSLL
jgi:sorbose reductase